MALFYGMNSILWNFSRAISFLWAFEPFLSFKILPINYEYYDIFIDILKRFYDMFNVYLLSVRYDIIMNYDFFNFYGLV